MDAEGYVKKYEMKSFGRLLDAGPSALAKCVFSAVRAEMVEALAMIVSESARYASTAATLAGVRRNGYEPARARWEAIHKGRRRAMWSACAGFARLAAVLIAAALGPDPVSQDEAGTGLDGKERILVALLADAGRSFRERKDVDGGEPW